MSPDEVRDMLRADEKSGYNALAEVMEGDPLDNEDDPFDIGGGENSQDPFSSGSRSEVDGNVEFSATQLNIGDVGAQAMPSTTGALDEWEEYKHPRKKNGQFGKGDASNSHSEKSSKRDKILKRTRKEVQLPKDEYAQVMHELNTNLTEQQRKKKTITKYIGDYKYTVQNRGFNEYRIINKRKI